MNHLRFGALLMMRGRRLGFYLSHRVVLTIPKPGPIRAAALKDFQPAQVFACQGIAVPFFEALVTATTTQKHFASSLEMVKHLLSLPEEFYLNDLIAYLKRRHGAELEEFSIPVPQNHPTPSEKETMDTNEIIDEFNAKYNEARIQYTGKRPNILVCGYTGSGKSSLAKAILGDVVPDHAIGDGRPQTMGYDCYENELIRIWDSRGLENGQAEEEFTAQTRQFVRERQSDPNVDNHIHLVWCTIQGSGARVTDCDLNLIRNIFNPEHVIVVITKADITRSTQQETMRNILLEAGVPAEHILFTSDADSGATGCQALMELSHRMLPEAYRDAFLEAQRIDLEARRQAILAKRGKAKAIVATAVTAAAGAGAIPIPLSDAAVLIPIQITMIASLAGLYGLRKEAVKQSALPFVAKLVGVFASSSLLKLIPGLGSAVNAAVAATLTGAMGRFVRGNFEETALAKLEGRPTPNLVFDVELFKKFYLEYQQRQNQDKE